MRLPILNLSTTQIRILLQPLWRLIPFTAAMTVLHPSLAAAEHADSSSSGTSLMFIIIFAVGTIAISVLLIMGITRWGHKQDQIHNMMAFCIKYLVESRNDADKIDAAQALGDAKDPAALLILINIADDDGASEGLRKAATEALQEMSEHYHQYTDFINECLKAVAEKDHKSLVQLLLENFEDKGKKREYVQSAYLIGREYMRMEEYLDARIWLQYASSRNRKARVYEGQISHLVKTCNRHLFEEGDTLFRVGEYHDALERYELAAHHMEPEEKRDYLAHVRLACTFCKMHHYEDAYQETLHALQEHHMPDTSLNLNKLLQQLRSETPNTPESEARHSWLEAEIASHADNAMAELLGQSR